MCLSVHVGSGCRGFESLSIAQQEKIKMLFKVATLVKEGEDKKEPFISAIHTKTWGTGSFQVLDLHVSFAEKHLDSLNPIQQEGGLVIHFFKPDGVEAVGTLTIVPETLAEAALLQQQVFYDQEVRYQSRILFFPKETLESVKTLVKQEIQHHTANIDRDDIWLY